MKSIFSQSSRAWRPLARQTAISRRCLSTDRFLSANHSSSPYQSPPTDRFHFTHFLREQEHNTPPAIRALGPTSPVVDDALQYSHALAADSTLQVANLWEQDWVHYVERLQSAIGDEEMNERHARILWDVKSLPPSDWQASGGAIRQEELDSDFAIVRLVATVMIQARHGPRSSLLELLGAERDRWDLVSWIVRALTERKPRKSVAGWEILSIGASFNDLWEYPGYDDNASQAATNKIVESLKKSQAARGVEDSDLIPDSCLASQFQTMRKGNFQSVDESLQHTAIGIALWSLGRMLLTSRITTLPGMSDTLMNQALNLLSIMHHNGVIPHKTYVFDPLFDHGHRQTPILADLHAPLLYAILDAEWNTFQQDVPDAPKYESMASLPIPNFQFPVHGSNPGNLISTCHEVWLEMLLWVMLRGGWVFDGMHLILEAGFKGWSASSSSSMYSVQDGQRTWTVPPLTISSELLASYVDAITLNFEDEWARAAIPEMKKLFSLSDQNNLGFFTWDNMVVRGLARRDQPLSVGYFKSRRYLELTGTPLSNSVASIQAKLNGPGPVSGMSDTELKLSSNELNGLAHQALWEDLHRGDLLSAVETLLNIQTSERNVAEESFPGSNKIPEHTMAALVDAVVALDAKSFGPKLLFPPLEQGQKPMLEPSDYAKPLLAKSLIRYATAVRDDELLREILLHNRRVDMDYHPLVALALLEAQIENQQWQSAEHTIASLQSSRSLRRNVWVSDTIVNLARAVMRLRQQNPEPSSNDLWICSQLLRTVINQNLCYADDRARVSGDDKALADEIRSLLGVLSSIDSAWLAFCSPLFTSVKSQPLELKSSTFLAILEAVAENAGFISAWELINQWCQDTKHLLDPADQNAGVMSADTDSKHDLTTLGEYPLTVQLENTSPVTQFNDQNLNPAVSSNSHQLEEAKESPSFSLSPLGDYFAQDRWVRVNVSTEDSLAPRTVSFRGRMPVTRLMVRSMLVRAPELNLDLKTKEAVQQLLAVLKWTVHNQSSSLFMREIEETISRELELISTIKVLRGSQ